MNIQTNVSLTSLHTFKFPCVAQYFCEITTRQEAKMFFASGFAHDHDVHILGAGSNTVFPSYSEGIVVHNNITGKTITQQTLTSVEVKIGSGEIRDDVVQRALSQGRRGMENLVAIPGTVGATAVQNIGAYGKEAKDLITSVEYCSRGKLYTKKITDQDFGYRTSFFKTHPQYFITAVTYRFFTSTKAYTPDLSYGDLHKNISSDPTPQGVADAIQHIREQKLPDRTSIGTAGSFFKNPFVDKDVFQTLHQKFPELKGFWDETTQQYKLSAGQLIDLAVGKGYTHQHVKIYDHHALVLIHTGGGTVEELYEMVKHIQEKVQKKYTILLEPEVVMKEVAMK